jgi:transposase
VIDVTPGVGVLVALTDAAAIDDPARLRSSKVAGAHSGLTPTKYQSGETDVTGLISEIGDASVRTALYEAANVILTRPVRGSSLKRVGQCGWRSVPGMCKAKVALARKRVVVLHRMLSNEVHLSRAKLLPRQREGKVAGSGGPTPNAGAARQMPAHR